LGFALALSKEWSQSHVESAAAVSRRCRQIFIRDQRSNITRQLSLSRDRISVLLIEGISQSAVKYSTACGYTLAVRAPIAPQLTRSAKYCSVMY